MMLKFKFDINIKVSKSNMNGFVFHGVKQDEIRTKNEQKRAFL